MSTTPKNNGAEPQASKQAKKKSSSSKKNDISNAPIFLRVSHLGGHFALNFVLAHGMHFGFYSSGQRRPFSFAFAPSISLMKYGGIYPTEIIFKIVYRYILH
jgi:hypothetical protein